MQTKGQPMRCDDPLRRLSIAIGVVFVLSAGSRGLVAENWPQWRGPLGNGICREKNIPSQWSRTKNVAWRLKLPGPAGASPIVWNDRIFLTSVDGDQLILICVRTDGKQLWRQTVGYGNKNVRGDEGNSASPSPVTDGKHVWSFMATGDLACFDTTGKRAWKMNLQDRYGAFDIQFGLTSTPVLHEGRLFLQLIHGNMWTPPGKEALVIAMNALTGDEIWKSYRETGAYNENKHSYASPILYDDGTLKFLITHGADYTIAYRLNDGGELWRLGGLNPQHDPLKRYHPTLRFGASPTAVPGMIVVPTAKNGPVFAVRPNFKGDITSSRKAHIWSRDANTPDVPCPLIHGGLVYLCRENGNLICLEAATGKELYHERTHRIRHRASPVYADGKVYLTARDGRITVVQAGREFKMLAQNELGEDMTASPVISNGTVYLRTFEALWAIRDQRKSANRRSELRH